MVRTPNTTQKTTKPVQQIVNGFKESANLQALGQGKMEKGDLYELIAGMPKYGAAITQFTEPLSSRFGAYLTSVVRQTATDPGTYSPCQDLVRDRAKAVNDPIMKMFMDEIFEADGSDIYKDPQLKNKLEQYLSQKEVELNHADPVEAGRSVAKTLGVEGLKNADLQKIGAMWIQLQKNDSAAMKQAISTSATEQQILYAVGRDVIRAASDLSALKEQVGPRTKKMSVLNLVKQNMHEVENVKDYADGKTMSLDNFVDTLVRMVQQNRNVRNYHRILTDRFGGHSVRGADYFANLEYAQKIAAKIQHENLTVESSPALKRVAAKLSAEGFDSREKIVLDGLRSHVETQRVRLQKTTQLKEGQALAQALGAQNLSKTQLTQLGKFWINLQKKDVEAMKKVLQTEGTARRGLLQVLMRDVTQAAMDLAKIQSQMGNPIPPELANC